jgi:type IV secretory pathway ATPase VirB11/archaellum biosynthesis ATPase
MNPRSTLDIAEIAAERARRGPPLIKKDTHNRELYEPDGKILTQYLMSDNKVDIICGPIGSGKTNAMFRALADMPCSRRRARAMDCARRDGWSQETLFRN